MQGAAWEDPFLLPRKGQRIWHRKLGELPILSAHSWRWLEFSHHPNAVGSRVWEEYAGTVRQQA